MNLEGTVAEVSGEITKLTQKITTEKKWDDGDWLSRAVVGLASYNATLGNYVASYENDQNQTEAVLKMTREKIIKEVIEGKRGEKKTEAYAKATARIDTAELEEEYINAQYRARLLNLQRTDTNNLITAIQSRLRYLGQQQGA